MHKAIGSKPEKLDKAAVISPEAFKKNDDDTWVCIKNTDIKTPNGIHRLSAGVTFRKNKPQWGIDVFGLLEQEASIQ